MPRYSRILGDLLARLKKEKGVGSNQHKKKDRLTGRTGASPRCLGETTWHGKVAMRLSVSNWSTTRADIDRSADAILAGF